MANLISVNVLKFGHEEFGTTLADAKNMILSTEHIIYGTNVETDTGVDVTTATAATDAVATGSAHGITDGEYVRIGSVGDSVGDFDIASSDYVPGTIYKAKATGATGLFLHATEAHYDANTKQDITNDGSSLGLDLIRVQGEILYADTAGQNGGRPIKVRTVEPCVHIPNGGLGVSSKSSQLITLDCEVKNGVSFAKPAEQVRDEDLMINTKRAILAYEDGSESDDFIIWYDTSNLNRAGLDSPFVDNLTVDFNFGGANEVFVDHLGSITDLADLGTINVNGRTISFPDQSASGLVRLSNIASAYENSDTRAVLKFNGQGKPGWSEVIVVDTIAQTVAKTDSTNTIS